MAPPTTHPSVNSLTLDSFDPESLDQAVRGSSLGHTRLRSGRFRGSLTRGYLGSSWLDSGRYNLPLLAVGEMPDDKITLGYVVNTVDQMRPGVLNGHRITTPTPVLLTERAELHYRLPENTPWLAFQFPRDLIEDTDTALPGHFAGPLDVAPEISRGLQREFAATLEVLRTITLGRPGIPDPAACLTQIQAHLLDAFSATIASVPTNGFGTAPDLANASRLVRQATDFIQAHLDQPLRIGTICRETASDWKRLERAFLAVHGVTPKRFLTLTRLTRARRLLLQSTEKGSITRAAPPISSDTRPNRRVSFFRAAAQQRAMIESRQ